MKLLKIGQIRPDAGSNILHRWRSHFLNFIEEPMIAFGVDGIQSALQVTHIDDPTVLDAWTAAPYLKLIGVAVQAALAWVTIRPCIALMAGTMQTSVVLGTRVTV